MNELDTQLWTMEKTQIYNVLGVLIQAKGTSQFDSMIQ